MGNKIAFKSITARDLWDILKRCYLIVIAVAMIATVVLYVRAKLTYVPVYTSTATVVLIGENNEGEFNAIQFADDYNIANRIIGECNYLMKSRRVLNAVGEDVGISNGYGALYNSVVIENPEDTRIFNITVTASSPEKAKEIADSVAKNGIEEIQTIFNYDRLRVFEEGNLNKSPSNGISVTTYVLFGAIAGAAVYALFLMMYLFDSYIHTEEDIERYLGLSVIGEIPDANYIRKKRYSAYTSKPLDKTGKNNNADVKKKGKKG